MVITAASFEGPVMEAFALNEESTIKLRSEITAPQERFHT